MLDRARTYQALAKLVGVYLRTLKAQPTSALNDKNGTFNDVAREMGQFLINQADSHQAELYYGKEAN